MEELLKGKTKIKLSDLYYHLLHNNLSNDERLLLARIIKDLAIRKEIISPIIVFGGSCYVDLEEKEPRNNF